MSGIRTVSFFQKTAWAWLWSCTVKTGCRKIQRNYLHKYRQPDFSSRDYIISQLSSSFLVLSYPGTIITFTFYIFRLIRDPHIFIMPHYNNSPHTLAEAESNLPVFPSHSLVPAIWKSLDSLLYTMPDVFAFPGFRCILP